MTGYPLDALPLGATAVLLFVGLMLAFGAGRLIVGRTADHDSDDEGFILSAALGLLALLIGFTFSLSLSRYEERRDLVRAEANAIGTATYRAYLMPRKFQETAIRLHLAYAEARLSIAAAGEDSAAIEAAEARADTIGRQIWRNVIAASEDIDSPAVDGTIIQINNDMLDLGTMRHTALSARLPVAVVGAVIVYALVTALLFGYCTGRSRQKHLFVSAIMFLLLTIAITLILDLDRPRTGFITISQMPLEEVIAQLKTVQPKG
ncbi:bestrophin-like domain [Sandaracinobacteroides saxicola]|uniref:DUF4239 domain-containing protein n=1 Tax=Sandaracinobacteroides saxicola TaxID=2759707 RepID=A0A7G5IGX7_9SPHN|nr:hypothetical protein [Sandaracinobacteroides saxicola]QMW22619.1 hypothetical protein H3309_15105 [Sandaracinobacteroides saxicola]